MDALVYFFRVGLRASFEARYPLHLSRSIKGCTGIRKWGDRVWGESVHLSRREAEEQFGETGNSKTYGEHVRFTARRGGYPKGRRKRHPVFMRKGAAYPTEYAVKGEGIHHRDTRQTQSIQYCNTMVCR